MKIKLEESFGVPTTAFAIGATTGGYTLQFSVDNENWTNANTATSANETHIINGCPKNLYWRLKDNTDENVLVQW